MMWNSVKWSNMYLIGVPEEEKRETRTEKIVEEIYTENFSKLMEDIIQESRSSANLKQINYKESNHSYIIVKLLKPIETEKKKKSNREKKC